jgi:ribonuclease P protein component
MLTDSVLAWPLKADKKYCPAVAPKEENDCPFLQVENKSLGRLQRNADFLDLRHNGKKLRPQSWLVFNYKPTDLGHLRLGITASRKVATAVLRNKLKRWSREYARQFIKREFNPSYDLSVVFMPTKEGFYKSLTHVELFKEFDKIFLRFKRVEPPRE